MRIKKSRLEFAWGPSGGSAVDPCWRPRVHHRRRHRWQGIGVDRRDPTSRRRGRRATVSRRASRRPHRATVTTPERVLDDPTGGGWKSEPVADPQWLLTRLRQEARVRRPGHRLGRRRLRDVVPGAHLQRRPALVAGASRHAWKRRARLHLHAGRRVALHQDRPRRQQPWAGLRDPLDGREAVRVLGLAEPILSEIARDAPTGWFPKYFSRQQTYWTVVGVDGDDKEALLSDDGALEVDEAAFSIEPFLYSGDGLITWADMQATPSLRDGYLPIPTVALAAKGLRLDVTAFAGGAAGLVGCVRALHRDQHRGHASRRRSLPRHPALSGESTVAVAAPHRRGCADPPDLLRRRCAARRRDARRSVADSTGGARCRQFRRGRNPRRAGSR